jgi:hypothetical protein
MRCRPHPDDVSAFRRLAAFWNGLGLVDVARARRAMAERRARCCRNEEIAVADLQFFATRSDHQGIFDFVTTLEGVRIFETYSRFGQELREFRSFDELTKAYDVGADKHGHGISVGLTLWWPDVDPNFQIRRIVLDPESCQGHTVRWVAESSAGIVLQLGGIHEQIVTVSRFAHLLEAGARRWGKSERVDWAAVTKLSSKIQYHIRTRLAVTRADRYLVLAEAYSYVCRGYELRNGGWKYKAPPSS